MADDQNDRIGCGRVRLTGRAAQEEWQQVRTTVLPGVIAWVVVVLGVWLGLHPAGAQLGWASLGAGLLLVAVMFWRHGYLAVSMNSGGPGGSTSRTFDGWGPAVSARVLSPVLALVGVALLVAATPTRLGSALARPFQVAQDTTDAALGLWAWVSAIGFVVVMLVIVGAGVWAIVSGLFLLVLWCRPASHGGRVGELGLARVAGGVVALCIVGGLAALGMWERAAVLEELVEPFRRILTHFG